MKKKSEFEQFDKVMDGLLAVPYSELQKRLEEEKRAKEKQKGKRAKK
jgi:inner membrane protein involved in colicin E2 resistance